VLVREALLDNVERGRASAAKLRALIGQIASPEYRRVAAAMVEDYEQFIQRVAATLQEGRSETCRWRPSAESAA
jgi:hypothetical protein